MVSFWVVYNISGRLFLDKAFFNYKTSSKFMLILLVTTIENMGFTDLHVISWIDVISILSISISWTVCLDAPPLYQLNIFQVPKFIFLCCCVCRLFVISVLLRGFFPVYITVLFSERRFLAFCSTLFLSHPGLENRHWRKHRINNLKNNTQLDICSCQYRENMYTINNFKSSVSSKLTCEQIFREIIPWDRFL